MVSRAVFDRSKGAAAALGAALRVVTKKLGGGALMRLGEQPWSGTPPAISTGSTAIDRALGTGGLPRGRLVEVFGPESSGKTTLALHVIAEAQKGGGVCAFVDAENALCTAWVRAAGIDVSRLLVCRPDCGEHALAICEQLLRTAALDVLVLDSLAALLPQAEMEARIGDAPGGAHARLVERGVRRLAGIARRTGAVLLLVDQTRYRQRPGGGGSETPAGGQIVRFHAAVRLETRRADAPGRTEETAPNRVRVKIVKNRLAPPLAI